MRRPHCLSDLSSHFRIAISFKLGLTYLTPVNIVRCRPCRARPIQTGQRTFQGRMAGTLPAFRSKEHQYQPITSASQPPVVKYIIPFKFWWVAPESNRVLSGKNRICRPKHLQPLGPEDGFEPSRTSYRLATTGSIKPSASPEDSG